MDKNIFKVKGSYVNGQWFNSKNRYDIFNPSNGEKLTDVPNPQYELNSTLLGNVMKLCILYLLFISFARYI